jgi:hypothetical protein
VRRAQHYLVEDGYLERIVVGGGRSSTRWRIVVDKLAPQLASRHNSGAVETRQTGRDDTAQERRPWFSRRMDPPAPVSKSVTPPSLLELRSASVCAHGGDGGRLPDGQAKCPLCRRGAP